MDTVTLLLAAVLASVIMTATLFVMHRASPRETCLIDWSWAGALFVATNVLSLVATQATLPFLVAPALGNGIYVTAHGAMLAGVRRHLGLRPGWPWLIALFGVAVAAHALPFVQSSVTHRLFTFYPAIMLLNLAAAYHLWRAPAGDMKPAYWPLLLAELFFFVQLFVRLAFVAADREMTLTFLGSQFAQTSGSLAILVFLSVATMGCAIIVIRHQELALRRMSLTDGLTGWLNRHALRSFEAREGRRITDAGHARACLLFDIDHFKSINDRHGHAVGDTALRHVSALAAIALDGHEARFRIGGEEFAVLLRDADRERLLALAERVRREIADCPLTVDGRELAISVSVGVAIRNGLHEGWEDLLRRADHALYRAKGGGRNRVTMSDDDGASHPATGNAVTSAA